MENDSQQLLTTAYPFPTPEISVPPELQPYYDAWAKQRDAQPQTLQEKLTACKTDPHTRTQIMAMAIGMIVLCIVMKYVIVRIAGNRRNLEKRLTARTRGRVVSTRLGAIGRRVVRYATVDYEIDGFGKRDEYLLGPADVFNEGDEVDVYYDPRDKTLSQLGPPTGPTGREYDVVFIPFIVISLIALLWLFL